MENFVGPIIAIVKFVGGSIVRYLKYQIKFNVHLEQFNVRKQHLCSRKCDIESRLHTELRLGKVAKEEVQTWLNDVEKLIAKQGVADEVNDWGCLSCCCRVKVLQERAQDLNEIYDRGGSFTNVCLVQDDPFFSAVELPTTELQGNEDVEAKILASLMGVQVAKLGVWGMGGVGKTTIMEHVHNKLLKEAKFKKIIWATMSQPFDNCKLQEQIASTLKEEDILKHPNTTVRAGMLLRVLERHMPYLLILDDVWESFELTAIGIPEPLKSDGCKLVLTTRSQEVARRMDCEIIEVKTLPEGEALKLFINKVGDIVLSDQGCIKETLESTLVRIVDECDGLPLAIVTVASSLKRVAEPRLWSAALNQLKECKRKVAGTDDDAFGVLKFSYDRLKSLKIQHCFLCCALYPEDHNIEIDDIIDYWIDEGLIDQMETVKAMEDEGLEILSKLVDNCLLESMKDRFEGNCVRMHDLVRDMALQITRTSPRFMVEAGKVLTKLPEKGKWTEELEKVSLMWNKIEEIPSSILSSKCTMLTTLLLSHNNLSTISESVFEHMPVLKILDLSYNSQLRSLPSSISKLVNLTTFLLQYCESLTEVPSFSKFGALKKLDLGWTRIKEVPKGLEMCTNLEYLSLRTDDMRDYCDILDDAILLNLSKLQKLFLDGRIALKGEVIGRLEKLEAFHGRFPTAHDYSFFWKCVHDHGDKLSRYFLRVQRSACFDCLSGSCKVEFFDIDIAGENIILPPSLDELLIHGCDNLRSLNDFSSIEDAKYLKRCVIRWGKGMEFVFSSWTKPLVQTLEELSLWGLHKLEGLFEAEVIAMSLPLPLGTLSSLKSIELCYCGKIKKFIPALLGYLQSLERIEVRSCEELEEIIASDPEGGGDIIKKLILPKLKVLSLIDLPTLKSICSRRVVMVCDSLEAIYVEHCKELEEIIVSDPEAEGEGGDIIKQHILPKLKVLSLIDLPALKSICSRRAVMVCDSLEEIHVEHCKKLQEIIASNPEEEGEGRDTIKKHILRKLKVLSLIDLPALKSICSRRAVMVCDSLEAICVKHCKELEEIIASDLGEGGDIIKKLILPKLKALRLIDLPALKSICSRRAVMVCDSLEAIYIGHCKELKEIIASDPEEEGEEGDIIKKHILPKLKWLELYQLPALKSICSRSAVMGCDSLEEVRIWHCRDLRRIPVYLPLLDNSQPSPPPSLKKIYADSEEWWESLEWDHPNAKDVLQPMVQFD